MRAAAAAAWLGLAILFMTPSTAAASCMSFPTPQSVVDAIHSPSGGIAFVGTVRQHWFGTYLVEVQRSWQGRTPTRFVAVGPCSGDECFVRELTVGRSYLFWVGLNPGPMYSMSCGGPLEVDPKVIQLLGTGEAAPAFGPADVLALAGFVWWSAYFFVCVVAAIAVVTVAARLSRTWSTS